MKARAGLTPRQNDDADKNKQKEIETATPLTVIILLRSIIKEMDAFINENMEPRRRVDGE